MSPKRPMKMTPALLGDEGRAMPERRRHDDRVDTLVTVSRWIPGRLGTVSRVLERDSPLGRQALVGTPASEGFLSGSETNGPTSSTRLPTWTTRAQFSLSRRHYSHLD